MLFERANIKAQQPDNKGKQFKIIVEDGEVYLQCIDSFEDVFEINKEIVENLELTDILDPYLFDSHRDIINALFEVYYDVSNMYLQRFFHEKKIQSAISDQIDEKLRVKFGLEESRNRSTIVENKV